MGIDLSSNLDGENPVVVGRPHRNTLVAFDSIHKMLLTVSAAYELGLVTYGVDGRVEYNRKEFTDLAAQYNRTIEYWDSVS